MSMTPILFTPFELVEDDGGYYILKPAEFNTYRFRIEKYDTGISQKGNFNISLWVSFIAPNGATAFANGYVTFPNNDIMERAKNDDEARKAKHAMLANVSNFFKTIGHPEWASTGLIHGANLIGMEGYAWIISEPFTSKKTGETKEGNKIKKFIIESAKQVPNATSAYSQQTMEQPPADSDIPF